MPKQRSIPRARGRNAQDHSALANSQMDMMLLEQQNRKRLRMTLPEADPPLSEDQKRLTDHRMSLLLLEQQNHKRVLMAQIEADKALCALQAPAKDVDPGLATRVGRSTAYLANSVMSNPASAATSTLASSAAVAGKATTWTESAAGSSSSATWAQAGRAEPSGATLGGLEGGFREPQLDAGGEAWRQEVAGFETAAPVWDGGSEGGWVSGKGKAPAAALNATASLWATQFRAEGEDLQYTVPSRPSDLEATQAADGADVLALLDAPASTIPEETHELLATDIADAADVSAEDLFDAEHTAEEKKVLPLLAERLAPPPVFGAAALANPLLEVSDAAVLGGPMAKKEWLREWEDLLGRYTDEVWGDAIGLVQEARGEIERMKGGEVAGEGTALRRLRLVLGHVGVHEGGMGQQR